MWGFILYDNEKINICLLSISPSVLLILFLQFSNSFDCWMQTKWFVNNYLYSCKHNQIVEPSEWA